jgi:hypothetical protein
MNAAPETVVLEYHVVEEELVMESRDETPRAVRLT